MSVQLKTSRSQAQKIIKAGQVLINNKSPKKAGDQLNQNDEIQILAFAPSVSVVKKPFCRPKEIKPTTPNKIPKIKIIAQEKDYLIVAKPAGLLTHPTIADESQTLSKILAKKFPKIKKVGEDPARPGIVHRLDKDASGLMVVAVTPKMFKHLKTQFKNRTVLKEYLVLVHGQVKSDEGKIDFPLTRSKTSERMAAWPSHQKQADDFVGRPALTEFWVEKRYLNFTLLRVKIHTGRMHQIRAHMLAYNHPVVGDQLYFQKKQKRTWDEKCGRLFLHCVKLGLVDLSGQTREYSLELPLALKNFLKKLT